MGKVDKPRLHKAFVVATDSDWREFRSIVVREGGTLQVALGRLVSAEVARAARRARASVK